MFRLIIAAVLALSGASCLAATLTVPAALDATLFESTTGAESSGAGEAIFAGRTGSHDAFRIRRGAIKFDLSALPANVVITGVTLTLFLQRAGFGAPNESVSLYRFTSSWGEGASVGVIGNPAASATGDATWLHRFYHATPWSTPGGDFDPAASASTTITVAGQNYSWSGPGLIEDVQSWADQPATNFGWIIRADEINEATALWFNSRESTANQPQLIVTYQLIPEPAGISLLLVGLLVLGVRRIQSRVW